MDDVSPTLSVGFAIDPGDSFGTLAQLDRLMDTTEAKVAAAAEKIERATSGMVNTGQATAQILAFGSAHSRVANDVARDRARIEKSGEGMVRQMERQIETFGKTASEIRNMRAELRAAAAEERGLTELAGRLRAANAELNRLEQGAGRMPGPTNASRAAVQNLGFQVQDFAVQVVGGTSALRAFAQQAPQAAGALTGFQGRLGAVGAFLNGPWGIALTLGVTLLAGFGDKLFDAGEAAKAKKKAAEDLVKAIDSLHDANLRAVQSEEEQRTRTLEGANALLTKASATREATRAELERQRVLAQAALAGARSGEPGSEGIALLVPGLEGKVRDLTKALAEQTALEAKARETVRSVQLQQLDSRVAERTDQAAAATGRYNRALQDLRNAFLQGRSTESEYEAGALRLKTAFDAQTASIRESHKAVREFGREVNSVEASAIARAAGFQVNSAYRSRAEQERLYNDPRVNRPGNPVAKPGTSAHERGNALDIQFAAGVTVKRIRDAFADEGVKLTKVFAERGHWHVEWAKTGEMRDADRATAKQAREAAAAVKQLDSDLEEVTRRFDPARDAANDLADTLGKIAALEKAGRITPGQAMGYTLTAVQDDLDARSKSWGERAKSILKIDGDPLAGIIGQAEDQRRAAVTAWLDDTNDRLSFTADRWDLIARNAETAGQAMGAAFGHAGQALGDLASIYAGYQADRARLDEQHHANLTKWAGNEAATARENQRYALASSGAQVAAFGDAAAAAKQFFHEGSTGYKALQKAEQVFRAVQFALSVRAMAQDAIETGSSIAKSAARTASHAVEAVTKAISSLPFPLNIAAGAATIAALASIGVSIAGSLSGGGKNTLTKANDGTGTVLGDADAKSESLKRSIDALKAVDTLTSTYAREMAGSLRSIDSQIGGLASVLVRAGDINASEGVNTGFKTNAIGSILSHIPLVGGFLSSLFGTKTSVIASGLYGGPQSLGSILSGGFDASTYSDVEKKKKFLGITTSTKYSTQYGAADPTLENQFTLILRSFSDAITAAAGPLGESTDAIQARLNSFVVNIGKIDLKGLTGTEIQEKLEAIFGAAADNMAAAAFPGVERFQKAGEGMFETLVRVASTLEAVGNSLDLLSSGARAMSIDAKMGLAAQFDSVSDLTNAADAYFQAFYTKEEQAAAKTAQFARVFDSLGLAMPSTLAAFRALVEAQDLTTAAGQATYATLLQLGPAFADLQSSMEGAKSAADIASERQDLERKLLELRGDTAAIRALDLAKLDVSNRALQQKIWAVQDAQDAAKAAQDLADSWKSVGDSIMDEVSRIRGLTDGDISGGFAAIMGRFNAATAAARGGDQDAAKSLPGLSQALLKAAEDQATSRQELARVQAQTAASLEATYGVIGALAGSGAATTSTEALLAAAATTQAATTPSAANDDAAAELRALREELAQMRSENNAGHAATASAGNRSAKVLENVSGPTGGDAIAVASAA